MKINSKIVGMNLKVYKTVISPRHAMNYAAAIEDMNQRYFNNCEEATIVAPPMLSVALTWPIISRIKEFLEEGDISPEVFTRQVHYTEQLEFHAQLKPSEQLLIHGQIIGIIPHRNGTLVKFKFKASNQQGDAIFTEIICGLLRGVKCTDEGREIEKTKVLASRKCTGNSLIWETQVNVDEARPYLYDACSNISFPIHTSQKFARQVGLPSVILHGTATLAYAVREIINQYANGNPDKLKAVSCQFSGMVFLKNKLTVQLLSEETDGKFNNLYFQVLDQQKQIVIKNGFVRILAV